MRLIAILVFFLALQGSSCGGGEDDASTIVAPSQETCVAGDTVISGVPAEDVEDIIETVDADDGDSDETFVDPETLDQTGALRTAKVTIIGNCNEVHTEDNDVVSDDDTNVQLGQQTQ